MRRIATDREDAAWRRSRIATPMDNVDMFTDDGAKRESALCLGTRHPSKDRIGRPSGHRRRRARRGCQPAPQTLPQPVGPTARIACFDREAAWLSRWSSHGTGESRTVAKLSAVLVSTRLGMFATTELRRRSGEWWGLSMTSSRSVYLMVSPRQARHDGLAAPVPERKGVQR